MGRIGDKIMAKTKVRTMVGYGHRRGETYVNIHDLMLFLLNGIEGHDPKVIEDRKHIIEELRKLVE